MEGKDGTTIEAKWEKDLDKETNLSEMFDHGFDMYNHLNKIDEPTNSSKVQVRYIYTFQFRKLQRLYTFL